MSAYATNLTEIPWVLAKGGQSGLETLEESLGLVALGRELLRGNSCQDPCAESFPKLQKPSLSVLTIFKCTVHFKYIHIVVQLISIALHLIKVYNGVFKRLHLL